MIAKPMQIIATRTVGPKIVESVFRFPPIQAGTPKEIKTPIRPKNKADYEPNSYTCCIVE